MVKTWSKYTNELPNIVFNQMFTCFSCAGQNVASVMDTFRENCPDCNSQSVRCLRNELEKDLEGGQSMIYPEPSVLAKAAPCDYFGKHLHKDRLRKDSWMYFHVLSEPLVHSSS